MNFGDPRAIGTEMADRFVMSGANLPPPLYKIGLSKIAKMCTKYERPPDPSNFVLCLQIQ